MNGRTLQKLAAHKLRMQILWLEPFLALYIESEAMSLIVIGPCVVAADKATGNLRGSDFLTAVNSTRQLQEDEPFMPLANVYPCGSQPYGFFVILGL